MRVHSVALVIVLLALSARAQPAPTDSIETVHSDAVREIEMVISKSDWYLMGRAPQAYRLGSGTTSGMEGKTAAFIQACNDGAVSGHGDIEYTLPAAEYAGKRVRLAGRFKKERRPGGAELYINALNRDGLILVSRHQPLVSGDWEAREVVTDVPDTATLIEFGVAFFGVSRNTVWLDKVTVAAVDKTVPVAGHTVVNVFQRDPAEGFSDCDGVHQYP